MPKTHKGQLWFRTVYYGPEDVMMVLDALLTDSSDTGDNKSSASDSESEFDLSNPEAGVAMDDDDELFVSIHDYLSQNSTTRLCKKYQIPLCLIGHDSCLKWY